ncbi:MAG: Ni/Fe hydrogenase subunit alpha [Alphaproteobacteria bacterium]|nr:Ni/Fe hydrogenase subunit alpha [Alphaproteobacteria bacterium]
MFELETAPIPQKLRRIAIDPVSRVEGHGKVTILLDDDDKVHQVRLHIVEFRGFEIFIKGRPYWEVPVTVQRLCGICPVSHHLAAVKAMDIIAGAPKIPPTAEKLRRLMHYGQILQSHALHFYYLSSPDLLLGFDCDVARRNIVGVIAANPEVATQGVLLRKYGQEIIRITSGKRIHGTGAIPGGMNKTLTKAERDEFRAQADQMVAWAAHAVQLCKELYATDPRFYYGFGDAPSSMMSLVNAEGGLDLYHGGLRVKDVDGRIIFDHVDYSTYDHLIREEAKPWSYMKFPHLNALGPEKGWYKVGPLARVQAADFITSPLAEKARQDLVSRTSTHMEHGALVYHLARLIEMLHATEMIRELLDDPDITGSDILADFGPQQHEAVGVIEAPRGTLFHHYRVNDEGQVEYCNLIVSTTNNNQAMNTAIRHVAVNHLNGRTVTEGLLNHIEVAIRAYDPCLSCATHAVGKMPLEVELFDAEGALLSRLSKNAGGIA